MGRLRGGGPRYEFPARQAYAKLVCQGYPYPGGPAADRSQIPTGVVDETAGMLWHVYWPNLDKSGRVFNLAFSKKGGSPRFTAGRVRPVLPPRAAHPAKVRRARRYGGSSKLSAPMSYTSLTGGA